MSYLGLGPWLKGEMGIFLCFFPYTIPLKSTGNNVSILKSVEAWVKVKSNVVTVLGKVDEKAVSENTSAIDMGP